MPEEGTLGAIWPSMPLEEALYDRPRTSAEPLSHHSDRGVQRLSIRHTERVAQAGIEPSVGSAGDSYNNALAESIVGLYKTEETGGVGRGKGGGGRVRDAGVGRMV